MNSLLKNLKEVTGKILCSLSLHYTKMMGENECSLMDGRYCIRKDCDWKIEPLNWPKPGM